MPPDPGAPDDGAPDDGASTPDVPGPGAPPWEALARVLADEPPAGVADDDVAPAAGPRTNAMAPPAAPGTQDAAARQWLATHPDEAARLAALDRIVDAVMSPSRPTAAPVDVEAALARVTARRLADAPAERPAPVPPARRTPAPAWADRPTTLRWGRRRLTSGVTSGVAVAAVLLAGAGLARWWADRGGDPASAVTPAARRYATAVGQRDSLRLPDGTRIVLGPASTLDVPAGYGATARTVTLDGEAFFVVPHDSTRPFVVLAGPAAVHDLGTAFTVRRDAPDRVAVAVTEGAVRLATAPAAQPVTQPPTQRASAPPTPPPPRTRDPRDTSGIVLRAGQRGVVALGPGPALTATRLPGPATADTAWTSGRLVFRDAPLPEVAGALRRWYGVELRVADPALASRHLTATFRGEPLADVLRVVGLALGARLDQRGDTVLVRAPR